MAHHRNRYAGNFVIRFNISVSYADGSAAATVAGPPDLVAFEAAYDRSVARFETELRMTDILFLAWHSLKRQGKTSAGFDDWLNTVEDFQMDGAAEVPPSETPASTG
jgi:hypothetical protein